MALAPEQFRSAKSVGYPADLYAVGVVVFRTLTGRLPFVSRSLEAIIRMKTEQNVPVLSSMPGMIQNPLLDRFVQKAMAREPDARFQSAREMLEQWWSVMASLDEEGSTDVMCGFGRVDESYAGRRPEPRGREPLPSQVPYMREVTEVTVAPQASGGTAPLAPILPGHPADHEDKTIRRAAARSDVVSSRPVLPEPTVATVAGGPFDDQPPLTLPSHGGAVGTGDDTVADFGGGVRDVRHVAGVDPFDIPTRSDPNLRKLVERELELQKARRGQGD